MEQSESPGETVDELRQRLNGMKKTLANKRKTMDFTEEPRRSTAENNRTENILTKKKKINKKQIKQDIFEVPEYVSKSPKKPFLLGLIDGTFMSIVFGGALFVILSVSIYAFYNLYNAVIKKMHIEHEEL